MYDDVLWSHGHDSVVLVVVLFPPLPHAGASGATAPPTPPQPTPATPTTAATPCGVAAATLPVVLLLPPLSLPLPLPLPVSLPLPLHLQTPLPQSLNYPLKPRLPTWLSEAESNNPGVKTTNAQKPAASVHLLNGCY